MNEPRPVSEWTDPDMVGQSEYLAIYEVCSGMDEQMRADGDSEEEITRHIASILHEFIYQARGLLRGK